MESLINFQFNSTKTNVFSLMTIDRNDDETSLYSFVIDNEKSNKDEIYSKDGKYKIVLKYDEYDRILIFSHFSEYFDNIEDSKEEMEDEDEDYDGDGMWVYGEEIIEFKNIEL